jgi:hypothetical protein
MKARAGGRKVGLLQKLTGHKGGLAAKLAGNRGKLAGKLAAKFGKPKVDLCAPKGGGCAGGSCNAGYTTADFVGALAAAALLAMIALALAMASGCATQPSRAQTMTIRDNVINVFVQPRLPGVAVCDTNAVPSGVAGGDTLCQAMMIETGGSESNNQNASTDPALTLPVGDTAISAIGEMIGAAVAGGAKALTKTDEKEPTTTP